MTTAFTTQETGPAGAAPPAAAGAGAGARPSGFTAFAAWLTVERALYALVLLAAAALRWWGLGAAPLAPHEATAAWPAWLQANGLSVDGAPQPVSALLYTSQLLAFWLSAVSDAAARWLPALAGTAAVALAWPLRPVVGRKAALAFAVLLAVDPWLAALSRSADGAMPAAFCALAVLVWILRPDADRAAETGAAVAAGLLLACGPAGWSFAPVLLLAWWLLRGPGGIPRRLLWLAPAAFVLGATAWFAHLGGLAAVGDSFGVWLGLLTGPAAGGYPLSWAVLRLLADAPLALALGAAGLALLWRDARRGHPSLVYADWPLFLSVWTGWGLLHLLLPGRSPWVLPVLALPLLLAAGHAAAALVERRPVGVDPREAGALLGGLVVLGVAALFWYLGLVNSFTFDLTAAFAVVLIAALMVALAAMYAVWAGLRPAVHVAALFLVAALAASQVAASIALSHDTDPARSAGFYARTAHPAVRTLSADIGQLSAVRVGDPGEMLVQAQSNPVPDPLLAWHLRSMRNLTWTLSPAAAPVAGRPPLLLTVSADPPGGELADSYMGTDYDIAQSWLPGELLAAAPSAPPELSPGLTRWEQWEQRLGRNWGAVWRPLLRWLVYRELPARPSTDSVVLWAPLSEAP